MQADYLLKVKVVTDGSPPKDLCAGNAVFSVSLDYAECDAVLSYHPNEEFLRYPGIKAWYCSEAMANWIRATRVPWKRYLKRLKPEEFLIHSHGNPRFRVPHPTHWDEPLPSNHREQRLCRAVAVISNHEPVWKRIIKRRFEAIRRSRFVAHGLVDLYGRRQNWDRYRRSILSRSALPVNWKGEVSSTYASTEKLEFLAGYKVCICLENACEPFYFTEKFVDAARAGCVPIYHAHPTVRDGVLQGARWVEAGDFGFDTERAVKFALQGDIAQCWQVNDKWLNSDALRATSWRAVHERISAILFARKLGGGC